MLDDGRDAIEKSTTIADGRLEQNRDRRTQLVSFLHEMAKADSILTS